MFNVKPAKVLLFPELAPARMGNMIKLPQLRSLADAELLGDVTLVGRHSGWVVMADTGYESPQALASAEGRVRVFTTADSAINQLRRIGVTRFSVDAGGYETGTLRAGRPDRAIALTQAAATPPASEARLDAVQRRLASGSEKTFTPDEARARLRARSANYHALKNKP